MASISKITKKNKDGKELVRRRILFTLDGERRGIYLGNMSHKDAQEILRHVKNLIHSKLSGEPPRAETSAWLGKRPSDFHDKLVTVGLAEPRKEKVTLGGLLDAFFTSNSQAKPATFVVWGHVARNLKKHFGEKHPLRSIGRAEAESFRQFLIRRP